METYGSVALSMTNTNRYHSLPSCHVPGLPCSSPKALRSRAVCSDLPGEKWVPRELSEVQAGVCFIYSYIPAASTVLGAVHGLVIFVGRMSYFKFAHPASWAEGSQVLKVQPSVI